MRLPRSESMRGPLLRCLIVLTALLSFPLLRPTDVYARQGNAEAPSTLLTPAERAWLKAHPDITLGYTDAFEPEVIVNPDGTYRGIQVDILDELNRRLGTSIRLRVYPVAELLAKARKKEIDGIPDIHPQFADKLGLLRTRTYFTGYPAVFARRDARFDRPTDLAGKRIAIIDEVFFSEQIIEQYGDGAAIVKVKDALEGLQRVDRGEADLYLGASINAYLIAKYQLLSLAPQCVFYDHPVRCGMGIRADWPELVAILNKGLASFSKEQIESIVAKWVMVPGGDTPIEFTPEERAWLEAHPDIELGYTDAFEPEVITNPDGTYRGILVDVLDELNRRLGTRIRLRIDPIPQLLAKAQTRETAGILNILPEYADELGLLATEGYMTGYAAVFARRSVVFDRPTDLAGKKVAIIDGVKFSEKIVEQYGAGATVLRVKDALEGLRCVDRGEVDLFLGASINAYFLPKYQLFGLALQYVYYDHPFKGGIAVRSDWPELASILRKGLSTFSDEEINAIVAKWVHLPQRKGAIAFTAKERAWLAQKHTVRVRAGDFPPYMFTEKDKTTGMVVDYLNEVTQRSGVAFELVIETRPWQEALESLMDLKGPDMVTSVSPLPEREPYMNFTEPYIVSPRMIFTRADAQFVHSIDDLNGRTVAAPRGTVVHKRVAAEYPGIGLLLCGTDAEAIEAVSTGAADAYIGNLVNTSHMISHRGFANLKVAAPCPFADDVYTFGIRRDWPELRSIINKVLDAMTPAEKAAIRSKYLTVRYEHGVRPADVLKWGLAIVGIAVAGVAGVAAWNRSLNRQVIKRTAELTETEGRFRATFEQAAVGIAHVAPDGRFLRVNQRFGDIVGYSHDEVLARTFQDITHPDDLDADLEYVRQLLAGEADTYSMEKRYIHRDGETVWVNLTVSLVRDAEGAPLWFVSVVENISARKRVEVALRESEGKFRQLMEQSPVSIQLMSPDGRVTAVNRAWIDLWGIPEDGLPEVLAKYNILEDEEARKRGVMPLIEKAFKGEAVVLPVIEYEAADTMDDLGVDTEANKVWVQVRLYPIRDSEDEVVSVVQMEEDITSRRKAEEQLHAYQERLRALASELTLAEERERRSIAADLHDHVGQTLALARVRLAIARRAASEEKQKAMLDEVSESVLEASRETRHLIFDLSSPSMNEIGLGAAVSEWLRERVGERYGLTTDFVDQAGRVPLTDDIRAILFRNVRELLTNAVKHAHARTVSVRLERDDGNLRIVIQDDGVGFSPDATDHKVEDTGGFGLFSIEERMADLGGTFEILSEPGAGCTAILTMPLGVEQLPGTA